MKVLLVAAGHPFYDSKTKLNQKLLTTSEASLVAAGHETQISDVNHHWQTEKEKQKVAWADTLIYITPLFWFNVPAPMLSWLDLVLLQDLYGNDQACSEDNNKHFMIVTASNLKKERLGNGELIDGIDHIDQLLQPLILSSRYAGINKQLQTFHADDILFASTSWVEHAYKRHLSDYFTAPGNIPSAHASALHGETITAAAGEHQPHSFRTSVCRWSALAAPLGSWVSRNKNPEPDRSPTH